MGEKESCASKYQKEIENLNYEFESQKNEVKQYEEEISIKKESIKDWTQSSGRIVAYKIK